jgi:hypothetical protein
MSGTAISIRAGTDVREQVDSLKLHIGIALRRTSASHFVALVLPLCSRPSPISGECPAPFREPLRFIVIAVMGAMSCIFPHTYGVFYVTINSWRVRGPSRHRHGKRHGEIGLGKLYSRPHDDDDAHDGEPQRFSRRWRRLRLPSEMDLLNSPLTSEQHVFYRLRGR